MSLLKLENRTGEADPVVRGSADAVARMDGNVLVQPIAAQAVWACLYERVDHVHRVPVQANELCFREQVEEPVCRIGRTQRLIAPASLTPPPQVGAELRAQPSTYRVCGPVTDCRRSLGGWAFKQHRKKT